MSKRDNPHIGSTLDTAHLAETGEVREVREGHCPACCTELLSLVCETCGWPRMRGDVAGQTATLSAMIAAERAALDLALAERDEARKALLDVYGHCWSYVETPSVSEQVVAIKRYINLSDQEEKALTERLSEVLAERDEARKAALSVSELHRRAQRLEGIEAHMETLRESHRRERGFILLCSEASAKLWWDRYRAAFELIRAAGVSDRIYGHDNHRVGSLEEMIKRLVAARDSAQTGFDDACALLGEALAVLIGYTAPRTEADVDRVQALLTHIGTFLED